MIGGRAGAAALALALGCAGNADAIARGQRYYEDNQYERALAIWRDLERRDARLTPAERTRYAYLRGMTDYRLGFREDARHWLALARANHERAPGSLTPTWLQRLDAALADLVRRGYLNTSGDVVQTIAGPSAEELRGPSAEELRGPSAEPSPPSAVRPNALPEARPTSGRADAGALLPSPGAAPGSP